MMFFLGGRPWHTVANIYRIDQFAWLELEDFTKKNGFRWQPRKSCNDSKIVVHHYN
ncbi:hypothetical protein KFK09_004306 [Dendrobium nobile]|uniref:Uncharacterized protein n=1 Tax=Dendrobium nobile TaxID=94219 RepID=A0A8T3C022_DENNO|nr:hypothetical protein KFK09_004306 [Dendrobium nobile]